MKGLRDLMKQRFVVVDKLEAVIQKFNSIVSLMQPSILTNLNERNTDKPCTPSKPNSSNDNATIMKSKMFQPSWK